MKKQVLYFLTHKRCRMFLYRNFIKIIKKYGSKLANKIPLEYMSHVKSFLFAFCLRCGRGGGVRAEEKVIYFCMSLFRP